jgi:Zn-finger protein
MGRYDVRPCPCGSGEESQWQYDAKGIPLCRTCDICHKKQMSRYRPEILNGYTQEDVDEQIEEDL